MRRILSLSGIVVSLFFISSQAFAKDKTICGERDDRTPSYNQKIARVLKRGDRAGCTLTMIGRTCAVSAGHCDITFEIAEFNTPLSRNGQIQHPEPEDIYEVDLSSVKSVNGGRGNDWAVLRLNKNKITDKLPGDIQGNYDVSFMTPKKGDMIRITGYGADRGDADRNFAQQTDTGEIFSLNGSIMTHRADTMGGNSGSSVILEDSNEIIGIHTHGGCGRSGGANASTLIGKHAQFKKAVKACLDWEAQNL